MLSFDIANFSIFKDSTVPLDGIRIFHIAFAAAAAAIISGAVAGRIRIGAYLAVSLVMATIVYPVVGRFIWGKGILHQLGMLDFAGGVVVHAVGGSAALACAAALGPRIERLMPDGRLRELTGYNFVITGLGVFTLWFAWFGFNCGSVLHFTENQALVFPIFLNTLTAAGVGFLIGMLYCYLRFGFMKPVAAIESLMAGLVAITASCAYVNLAGAVLIAAVGALIVHAASALVLKLRIDDPVNAFAVHAFPGLWGATAISFLAPSNVVPDRWASFAVQFGGGLACMTFAFLVMYGSCRLIALTLGLRVDKETEIRGIDREQHFYENRFASEDESHEARLKDQGRAIASLSHEILGSIGAAKAQTELLEMGLEAEGGGGNDSLRQRARKTLDGLRRAERVARMTLAYSRRVNHSGPAVSLAGALESAVEMVRATHIKSRVRIAVDVREDVKILADETRLIQAFYNIFRNACEAFGEDHKEGREIAVALTFGQDGGTLAISDNAGGMSQDVLSRIGETFQSGKSTGLGLHLTRQYLEQTGFGLVVETKVGSGTRFLIQIPPSSIWNHSREELDAHPSR